jgi:16S rRNA (adenine1518-N6/adenine1519-N6)-dimethyltransferase
MPRRFSRYKKRLGQHFLNSTRLAKKIVGFAAIDKHDIVLEIGPGKGMLTKQILEKAKKVYAVEIDTTFVKYLQTMTLPRVIVLHKNFLTLHLRDYDTPVVIGNIPYSITTPILQMLTVQRDYFKRAILTIQKEYGDRILAQVGCRQYGSITLYLNYYFSIKKGFVIRAGNFSPRPKVSSVVISLIKKQPPFALKNEEKFFQFIRGIFRYRRKSLKNAIMHYLGKLPDNINAELLSKRPEKLSIDDFYYLFNTLEAE